jgi:16S rRNA processing protein RimM
VQLVVGRIAKAHGVHGEVAVEVRTDDVERRFAVGAVLETEPPERGPLAVRAVRPHSGRLLVHFDAVDDRFAADALRGTMLVVDSATSPPTDDPEEFWDHDLVGLAAVTGAGQRNGRVEAVLHPSGTVLLAVRREDGAELLVPFVAAIVPEVDVAAGRLVVDPPDGLLDL